MRVSVISVPAVCAAISAGMLAWSHGDVTPQLVDTQELPDIGEEWLTENPYRDAGPEVWQAAIVVGASGYNQNCARCHGLGAISGGLAPDLRLLEADEYGDEWYIERYRSGYTQSGVTRMPAFGDLLGQKAAWAIRTYIEARPDNEAMDAVEDQLRDLRNQLVAWANEPTQARAGEVKKLAGELQSIAASIETLSGAPIADSAPFRAYRAIEGRPTAYAQAAEILTIGLSAAR